MVKEDEPREDNKLPDNIIQKKAVLVKAAIFKIEAKIVKTFISVRENIDKQHKSPAAAAHFFSKCRNRSPIFRLSHIPDPNRKDAGTIEIVSAPAAVAACS